MDGRRRRDGSRLSPIVLETSMTKLIIAAGATALLAVLTTAAFADQVTGAITNIDEKAGTVTLDNGKVYVLAGALPSVIMVGDVVNVTFKADQGGKLTASDIAEAYPQYP